MVLEIDLTGTDIHDLEIEREDGWETISFSISGRIEDVDVDIVKRAFLARELRPVSLSVETGYAEE